METPADFERISLPGILVDVESSTCYDLGEEKKALKASSRIKPFNLPFSKGF
jgi:hypothetical protein